MKRTIVAILLIIAVTTALSAFEGRNDNEGCQRHEMMMRKDLGQGRCPEMEEEGNMSLAHLDLTEAQMNKIEDLKTAHHKTMIQKHAEIQVKEVDLNTARKNQDFDQTKKITAQIFDLKKDMQLAKIDHQKAIWNQLTDEQKDNAKANLKAGNMMQNKHRCQNDQMQEKNCGQGTCHGMQNNEEQPSQE